MSNNALGYFNGGKKSAYCPEVENYAKKHERFIDKKHGKKGDVALFDFGKGRASHTGIVVEKTLLGYKVIEGNTSLTSNDNGGKVMLRTRTTKNIRGFYVDVFLIIRRCRFPCRISLCSRNCDDRLFLQP